MRASGEQFASETARRQALLEAVSTAARTHRSSGALRGTQHESIATQVGIVAPLEAPPEPGQIEF